MKPSLLTFPCIFSVKIIGKDESLFFQAVDSIINYHLPAKNIIKRQQKNSSNGKFIALTITGYFEKKQILDDLYQSLSRNPYITMAL